MTISSKEWLTPGFRVMGKWNKEHYVIEKQLGEGANGAVYLVRKGRKKFALKLAEDPADLQSEINVLRAMKNKGEPFLWDTDDLTFEGKVYPFYVMSFVEGLRLPEFMKKQGKDWLYIIIRRILSRLATVHQQGWVFGDLKPENILVAPNGMVELIDFGGVSQIGSSIKQFTEVYDRGFWNAGSRRADPQYDLFSLVVMVLKLADPQKRIDMAAGLIPQHRTVDDLIDIADSLPDMDPILPFIYNILHDKYDTAKEALEDYRGLFSRWNGKFQGEPVRLPWLTTIFLSTLTIFATILFFFYYG